MDGFLESILLPLSSSCPNLDSPQGPSCVGDGASGAQTTSTTLHECIYRNTNQNPSDHPGNMIFQESNLLHMNGQKTSLFRPDDFEYGVNHHHLCCFSDNQLQQEFLSHHMPLPTQSRNLIPDPRLSLPASNQGGAGSFCVDRASVGSNDSDPPSTFPPQSLEDSQSTSAVPPQLWSSVYSGVHPLIMDQINSQNYRLFPQLEMVQRSNNDHMDLQNFETNVAGNAYIEHEHQISQSGERHSNQAYVNPNPPITQEQQLPMSANTNGPNGAAKPRTRAKRGQATDPHSIAERLRREKIADRMKNLQALVPCSNKTDKASMLDEIIDYVKFLQLQVKVLNISRFGMGPLSTNIKPEETGCPSLSTLLDMEGGTDQSDEEENDTLLFEQEVVKLMESNISTAMQYLQTKGLCLMPTALATAISIQKGSSAAITPAKKNSDTSSCVDDTQRKETKNCNGTAVKREDPQKN